MKLMFNLSGKQSKLYCNLAIDSLLCGMIILPILLLWIFTSSLEVDVPQTWLAVSVLTWSAVSVASLTARLYRPLAKKTSDYCRLGKRMLIRFMQAVVVILVITLIAALLDAATNLPRGWAYLMLPFSLAVIFVGAFIIFLIPAFAHEALLGEEFSLRQTWRYANWTLKRAPLDGLSRFLFDLLVGGATWLPVVVILALAQNASNEISSSKALVVAGLTTALMVGAHSGVVVYQRYRLNR